MGLNGVGMNVALVDDASGKIEMVSLAEFTATRESCELPSKKPLTTVDVPCWAGELLREVGVPNIPKPSVGGVPLGRTLTPPAGVLSLASAASRMVDEVCPAMKSPRATL